jgi:hypothetical protein
MQRERQIETDSKQGAYWCFEFAILSGIHEFSRNRRSENLCRYVNAALAVANYIIFNAESVLLLVALHPKRKQHTHSAIRVACFQLVAAESFAVTAEVKTLAD